MQIELVWGIRHTICLLGPQSVPANSAELVGRFGGCLSCCLAGGLGCCIAVALAVASDVAYHPLTYVRHACVFRPRRAGETAVEVAATREKLAVLFMLLDEARS